MAMSYVRQINRHFHPSLTTVFTHLEEEGHENRPLPNIAALRKFSIAGLYWIPNVSSPTVVVFCLFVCIIGKHIL